MLFHHPVLCLTSALSLALLFSLSLSVGFLSARFSVDTFFFVSGFLVVYAMLRRFKHDCNGAKVQVASQVFVANVRRLRLSLVNSFTASTLCFKFRGLWLESFSQSPATDPILKPLSNVPEFFGDI